MLGTKVGAGQSAGQVPCQAGDAALPCLPLLCCNATRLPMQLGSLAGGCRDPRRDCPQIARLLTWAVRCFKVDRVLLSWVTAADRAGTLSVQLSLLAASEEGACSTNAC